MGTPKGTKPWNYGRGEGWTDKRGYRWVYVTVDGRRKARREHRVIMERHIGRCLEPWEIVHHLDENPSNNEISNLQIKEFGAHTSDHHFGTRKGYESKRTMEAFAIMREQLKTERKTRNLLISIIRRLAKNLDEDESEELILRLNDIPEYEFIAITRAKGEA